MSSGLELIPLGIALMGMLSQSVHSRYAEEHREQKDGSQLANLGTRMVDSEILAETLRDLGIKSEKTSTGIEIRLTEGVLQLQISTEGNFRALFASDNVEEALNTIHRLEEHYCNLFQNILAEQFLSNAEKAGMPIQRLASEDGIVRLRVTVS